MKATCVADPLGHPYAEIWGVSVGTARVSSDAKVQSIVTEISLKKCESLYVEPQNKTGYTLKMNAIGEMKLEDMLRVKLDVLRCEHRDLDEAIQHIETASRPDQLTLQRLKRHKLYLKDQIVRLEDRLIPDIIA